MRLFIIVALGISFMLLLDDLGAHANCPLDGCGEVRTSAIARPLGIPLPVVGTVGFVMLFALSLAGGWLCVACIMRDPSSPA